MSNGFTLIELLLVVVIIGIVAAFVLPRFDGVKEKAYEAAMKNDLRNIATEQEIYFDDNDSYASSVGDLGVNLTDDVSVAFTNVSSAGYLATADHNKTSVQCTLERGDVEGDGVSGDANESAVFCS